MRKITAVMAVVAGVLLAGCSDSEVAEVPAVPDEAPLNAQIPPPGE